MIVGEIRRYLRTTAPSGCPGPCGIPPIRYFRPGGPIWPSIRRSPRWRRIAQILGIKREDVVFALDAILDPVSLYEPIYSDSGDTVCVMDQVKDSKNTDEMWLEHIALKEAVSHLTEREQKILAMRFYQSKTQMEVSEEIGISQAQVSRLRKTPCGKSARSYEFWTRGAEKTASRAGSLKVFWLVRQSPLAYLQDLWQNKPWNQRTVGARRGGMRHGGHFFRILLTAVLLLGLLPLNIWAAEGQSAGKPRCSLPMISTPAFFQGSRRRGGAGRLCPPGRCPGGGADRASGRPDGRRRGLLLRLSGPDPVYHPRPRSWLPWGPWAMTR